MADKAAAGVDRSICARASERSATTRADFGLGRRTRRQPLDAVREIADLLFQPFDRHRPHGGRGQEVAHFLGLRADALERRGIDDALGDGVDLGVDRANLALEPLHRRLRIVGAQRVPDLTDQRLERRDERFARAIVAHRSDAFAQIAHRAFERDDGVARRKIGEAARHRRELGAQPLRVGGGPRALFALFAAHLVEAQAQGHDLIAQRLDRRRAARGRRRGRFEGRRRFAGMRRGFRRAGGRRGLDAETAPAALWRLDLGRARARVEFAAPARDLRDGLLHVEARALGSARRLTAPILDGVDAARERAHAGVELAFGLVEARFQTARRLGQQRLLAGRALVDRGELFGDGLERRAFLAAIGLAAFDPLRDRFEGARGARFRAFGAAFEPGDGRFEQFVGAASLLSTRLRIVALAARFVARTGAQSFVRPFVAARES